MYLERSLDLEITEYESLSLLFIKYLDAASSHLYIVVLVFVKLNVRGEKLLKYLVFVPHLSCLPLPRVVQIFKIKDIFTLFDQVYFLDIL